jgi:hypothetical protein
MNTRFHEHDTDFFDPIKLLAARCSHIPNKEKQIVRYCGYYRNVSCPKRKEGDEYHRIPCLAEAEGLPKEHPKDRVRFVQEVCD